MSKRTISIELFRDIATPDVSLDLAVKGLEHIRRIIPSLEIVERGGLVKLNEGTLYIRSEELPVLDIHTDFGIILTDRQIFMPLEQQMPLHDDSITIGLTNHVEQGSDYALVDVLRSDSVKCSTMHETGHLLDIPNKGKKFDGNCHCVKRSCIMHAELLLKQTDYCRRCTQQLAKSAMRLLAT